MADQHDQFRELAVGTIQLLINVGLINSISERWPEEVQDNWTQRLEQMEEYMSDQIREAQEFASALD